MDRQTGEIHNYTKKQGVIHTEIIPPKNVKVDEIDREDLWNLAEQAEKRKDARVAREFVIAIPHEISRERQIEVAKEFSKYLSDRYEVVADLAVHEPSKEGNDKNVHAHIMITTRKIAVDKESKAISLTAKSTLELSNSKRKSLGLKTTQDDIKEIREAWAEIANRALKREGVKERIDHRSYEDQGQEQIPTKHEGVVVTEMRRKGHIVGVAQLNEEIKEENRFIRSIKIEEQQNHKPSFLERVGLKKVEKIEENLPPISEVVKRIDKKIVEVEQTKLEASYEKIIIQNEIRSEIRAKESAEYARKQAERIAKKDPLESEYKQAVYGDSNHDITSYSELLDMNRFIATVKAGGKKTELLEKMKNKYGTFQEAKQPTSENKPQIEPKGYKGAQWFTVQPKNTEERQETTQIKSQFKKILAENRVEKDTRVARPVQKAPVQELAGNDKPTINKCLERVATIDQGEPVKRKAKLDGEAPVLELPDNETLSIKEEFKRVLAEKQGQSEVNVSPAANEIKIKDDGWDMDR